MASGSAVVTPTCAEVRVAGFWTSFLPCGLEIMIAPVSRRGLSCRRGRPDVLIGPDNGKSLSSQVEEPDSRLRRHHCWPETSKTSPRVGPDERGAAIRYSRTALTQSGDVGARLFSAVLELTGRHAPLTITISLPSGSATRHRSSDSSRSRPPAATGPPANPFRSASCPAL